ncbi:hypothetical protein [Lewinella sp. 4G2]|uniref:hypothetical protein n=1 Tax=Lewinella sp. 4G2 TaxID=1803372 RepID=UPI0007B4D8DD|nr:hypothetical protein [Lewinella sp. 4G2]OAV45680.1 hypothetical protein A3850_014795 [Lewinella sp. 4G2]
MRPFLTTLFVFLAITGQVQAQDGVFPTFDSRSRFLGGTGLSAEGIDALYTNPAGYAKQAKGELGAAAGAEQRFGVSELQMANIGAVYGTEFGGFGLNVASFGFDAYRETRFGLGYGRQLTDKLTIGADFHGFATSTEGYASSFNVTFGVGMQLQLIDDLAIGVRIFSPFRSERLPDEFLPQLLAIGASYTPTDQLTFNLEAHQDADNPVRVRAGLEYLPAEQISIRLGAATSASELSFGLGYRVLDKLEVSAGATYHEVLGLSPGFGIRWGG